ncbi:WGR domain-containing protein [Deinococcus taeanensis]|uniref:WGR domain-containing protein n=1 Tax=Deinococcus taeanensis TaxID=2737050 RepID=UPI001CDC41D3|nr:WGR domain-containing protein [Deinococcus taeanensis]UBV41615.1 WGR domain-containing protein [Deinococcus taeanensis]
MSVTYLEYSDPNGAEHKFYEVTLDAATLTIRYGRIGTEGQTQHKTFPSPEKAQAEADKKLREKRRKGYEDAVAGVRQKRAVMRRTFTETRSTTRQGAPLLWQFNTNATAFGIFADDRQIWVGNEAGQVYALTPDGEVNLSFKLPDGVKCLVRDAHWTFAGCDDGNVYDLSGKLPFVAYEVEGSAALLWMDIHAGTLAASDASGNVFAFDAESDQQWANVSTGGSMGWMVRVDDQGVYYGHSAGVGMYDRHSGLPLWTQQTRGGVLFGWQAGQDLYAGTTHNLIQRFTKGGEHVQDYSCDAPVLSCATSPGGDFVFAGDSGSAVYCFTRTGERLWKLGTGVGGALSMQYAGGRLYLVTSRGYLAALDASEAAIQAAQRGETPTPRDVKLAAALPASAPLTQLNVTSDAGPGVRLRCERDGTRLRVRAIDPRFHAWNVQFPRNLREAGATYLVDDLVDAGGFYRVVGEIRRIQA